MRLGLLLLVFGTLSLGFAKTQWDEHQTEKVVITSYDKNCVQIRRKNGQILSLKREGFRRMKMISGSTEVEIHPQTVQNHLCSKKK